MNFTSIPSKKEMMGRTPKSLTDNMKKVKLSGVGKPVIKGAISGAQFIETTESDFEVMPNVDAPPLSKIQSVISKGVQEKSKALKFPRVMQEDEEEVWDSDEFDNDSDHEDEGQHQNRWGRDYNSAPPEPQGIKETSSDEYEVPSSEVTTPPHTRVDKYKEDPVNERTFKAPPPRPPAKDNVPQRPSRAPAAAAQPSVPIDRSKKPGKSGPFKKDIEKSKGSTTKASLRHTKASKQKKNKPSDVSNKKCKPTPPIPPLTTQLAKVNSSVPEPRTCIQDLESSWYGGQMTRHQAEDALREMNKDGAFIIRDSSKGSDEHPYTLMLLNQDKVFNIRIRNQGNSYVLGNGLNNKSFPGVKEMITHHAHTPLLLIDAADPRSEAQSQCCLLHPAGF